MITTPRHRQRLMSRDEFERFLASRKHVITIALRPPYDVAPCAGHDINCHGWRLVEVRAFREDARTPDRDEAWSAAGEVGA